MSDENNFEKNMDQLEKIVDKLENGNLTLEESFKLFKEGLQLSQKLNELLNNIEGKITLLVNESKEVPFDAETKEENNV